MTQPPRLVEYDVLRVAYRVPIALLISVFLVADAHGYSKPGLFGRFCSYNWPQAFQFLMGLVGAMALIEIVHWIVWRVCSRGVLLPFRERKILVGRESSVAESLGLQAQEHSPGPRPYDLVLTGGHLALVPRGPMSAALVGFGLLLIANVIRLPDPCETAAIAWRALLGWIVGAYGALAIGSAVENEVYPSPK